MRTVCPCLYEGTDVGTDVGMDVGTDVGTHLVCAITVSAGETPPLVVCLRFVQMQVSPVPHMSTVCSHLYEGTDMSTHLGQAIMVSAS